MKIGIYVDSANIAMNGGYQMRYDVLRDFCLQGEHVIRLNTYTVFDEERTRNEQEYRDKQFGYYSAIRNTGFKVITKAVKWYRDEEGNRYGKGNADLDMAVDIMLQATHLDKIFILTGDGDFKRVVQAVQSMGVRVELIAFKNVSNQLIHEVDQYIPGYLIPELTPLQQEGKGYWGEEGSRVRGQVVNLNDGYGFIKMMKLDNSYQNVFFHFSELPQGHFAKLEQIFEFRVFKNERGLQAVDILLV